jgi:hypothetical protein
MGDIRPVTRDGKIPRFLLTALVILVLGALCYAVWTALETPREAGFLTMLGEVLKEDLPARDRLIGTAIVDNYTEYRNNSIRWSGTFHSCLFFSAALGAFAGLVLKLSFFLRNEDLKKDLAAFSAMASALLITFSTVGNFQTHWQANRLAAARLESLGYEFVTAQNRDPAYFSKKMEEISMGRNQEIVGSSDSSGQANVLKQ